MTDRPVYMIANLSITDDGEYKAYSDGFFPILSRHAGEFITYDDQTETMEGFNTIVGRVVILKFPSEGHARRWYTDSEYQDISKHRRAGTRLAFLVMVHGMPT
jgi:uncharacterized protein (DUF1330 family)